MARDRHKSIRDGENVKIVVLGAVAVGKSSLCFRTVFKQFLGDEHDPTIEDCYTIARKVDGMHIQMELVDTGGQEQYSSLHHQWYMQGDGFIVVYSVNEPNSWEIALKMVEKLMDSREEMHATPLVLVGNKSDLKKNVATELAERKAKEWQCPFYEVSAKLGNLVEKVFDEVITEVERLKPKPQPKKKKNRFCSIL